MSENTPAPILQLRNVSKSFGMTHALTEMSLDVRPGEIHAIVGENGAGKSTMIKIMTGVHQPDDGGILVDGSPRAIAGPQHARDLGVVAIYQEPMVFPDLDVAENVFVADGSQGPWRRTARERRRAQDLFERIGMRLDAGRIAGGLTLAEQQAVEIARALSRDVRALIMDEPTSSLSAHEAARLRRVAINLARDGVAVVYISHRLEEIFEIADRVTVIRDGRRISTRPVAETTHEGMIAEMVGREIASERPVKAPASGAGEPILEVEGLALEGAFEGIGFALHRGEVLCMAGLVGARRTDVALALFGATPATCGTIRLGGREMGISRPGEAMRAGIAYVSEDRRKLGLALPMSMRANFSAATLDRFLGRFGLLDDARERDAAESFRRRLNIRAPDVDVAAGALSGGNQQKLMLAKWLNMEPEILIFDEPTRGVDVGAKAEVHALVRSFAAEGGAALVISSDLPEVLALADRVLVMREGRQMGILASGEATQERIMELATGRHAGEEAA